jgi:hypothetical protein
MAKTNLCRRDADGTIFSVYLRRDHRPKTTAQAEIADK